MGLPMKLHAVPLTLAMGCLGLPARAIARAQAPASAVVRVHVTDAARAPLRDVDLALLKNGTEVVLLGRTDAAGRYTIRFEPESAQYRLVVRKVGYVQTARLLPVASRDTLAVEVSLARVPPALDTVRTQAAALPLAKQPFVGADEIERDTRAVFNLGDVLRKLRPSINYQGYRCPVRPLRVYANGRWVFQGALHDIHAEHILELHFVSCLDESIPGLPAKSWPSIYLTLKPGAAWDLKHGSYVADSAEFATAERERLANAHPPH
jgi:hypothetical protein